MYDKITEAMNADERFGGNFISSDIESYLRGEETCYVNFEEGLAIDDYLEKFL